MTVGFYVGFLFVAILWHMMNPEIPLGPVVRYLVKFYWGLFDGWLFILMLKIPEG